MKNLLLAFILSIPTLAFATGGISCSELTGGSMEIHSEEASAAGDNLVSLQLVIGGKTFILQNSSVSRGDYPNTIYVGSDLKGNMLTLVKDVSKVKLNKKTVSVSRAYVRLADRSIIQENMLCD